MFKSYSIEKNRRNRFTGFYLHNHYLHQLTDKARTETTKLSCIHSYIDYMTQALSPLCCSPHLDWIVLHLHWVNVGKRTCLKRKHRASTWLSSHIDECLCREKTTRRAQVSAAIWEAVSLLSLRWNLEVLQKVCYESRILNNLSLVWV